MDEGTYTSTDPSSRRNAARSTPNADDPCSKACKTLSDIPSSPIILSSEQLCILDKVRSGRNVFFTGSAGTGKSVLLREIVAWCAGPGKRRHAVTASTGIAAVNIGGITIQSWAGVGAMNQSVRRISGKILGRNTYMRGKLLRDNPRLKLSQDAAVSPVLKRWVECKLLIIDEISMITAEGFDLLEELARVLRNSKLPFGGIQLVVSGDFCQLPPIKKGLHKPKFAFEAASWRKCLGEPIFLTKVFRQSDQEFIDVLNAIRLSRLNQKVIETIRGLARPVTYPDGIEPTELYPTRMGVQSANEERLAALEGDLHIYKKTDVAMRKQDEVGKHPPVTNFKDKAAAPEEVHLKEGAQVMLIKNLVQGFLVNGTMGKVLGFYSIKDAIATGIRLGTSGMATPEQRRKPIQPTLHTFATQSLDTTSRDATVYPLVRFISSNNKSLDVLIVPCQFEINGPDGAVEGLREQIPLTLAWALSIHKSQGRTLARLRVDLSKTFAAGQVYVALSRATSLSTLEVYGFNPGKVEVDRRVAAWLRKHHYLVTGYAEQDEDLWQQFDEPPAVLLLE